MEEYNKKNENKEDIRAIQTQMIDDILKGKHDTESNKKLANYEAIFEQDKEPLFVNIWSIKKGYRLGYIVFHDFLLRVGKNKTFSSTDFEKAGIEMFKKAENEGLIKKISEKTGIGNITRWQVIKEPKESLENLKNTF